MIAILIQKRYKYNCFQASMKCLTATYLWGIFLLLLSLSYLSFGGSLGGWKTGALASRKNTVVSGRLHSTVEKKGLHSIDDLSAGPNKLWGVKRKRDLGPENTETTRAYGLRSGIALFTKDVTIRASSLVDALMSLNSTEIPSKKSEKFLRETVGLINELTARRRVSPSPEPPNEQTTTGEPADDKVTAEESFVERNQTSEDIGKLHEIKNSIAQARNRWTGLFQRVDNKIREVNITLYDCKDLADHLRDSGSTRVAIQDAASRFEGVWAGVTEDSAFDPASPEANSTANPENISVFYCTNQMMADSLDKLIGCVETEIEKGEETPTQVDFYHVVFSSMSYIAQVICSLNIVVMRFVPFNNDDLRAVNLDN